MRQVSMETVISIINANMEDGKLTSENLDDNLCELGMDSITFIQIVVALEEEFECEIEDSKLLLIEMDTVNKLVKVLQSLYEEK